MNIETLDNAVEEAKKFIEKAEKAIKRSEEDGYTFFGCKETAACKRASMDLTRALSELRKP